MASELETNEEPTLEELFELLAGIELYRVDMRPNPGFEATLGFPLREHLLWLKEREQEGRLMMCGMIDFDEDWDGSGPVAWDGTGMAIFRGESKAEVEALVAKEPYHAAGLRTNVVSRWQVGEGSLTLRVDLIGQRGSFL